MKLYELFGSKGFHTCIATTFGVDFGAFESIVLPRLRGAGCFNNMLMADARMLTYALDGESTLPQHAGRHYTVTGVGAGGVFHPKVMLQLGRRSGRLIVTSANVTTAGLAGNLELVGRIDCGVEKSGERQLVAAAWRYVRGLIDARQQGLDHQLEWLRPRTPWLFDTEPAAGPITLSDGTEAALLQSDPAQGIGSRFAALVEERPVKRLIVMSPYWDQGLEALKFLIRALQPRETMILIDSGKALFPAKAAAHLRNASLFELEEFSESRFVHAKTIIAETAKADHVLYGSANCTVAALGTERAIGANEEVCLYRRLRQNSIIASLGLTEVLDDTNRLVPSALPPYVAEEPLLFEEASLRSPGRFECLFDMLIWWPPSLSSEPDVIELLDAHGETLTVVLEVGLGGSVPPRRYQMSGNDGRPAFARLRFPDRSVSAPAIVTIVDKLRETIREARSNRAESAVLQLSDETEVGLWLWEVLNELEAAEAAQSAADEPGTRHARVKKGEAEGEQTYRTLDYDQFIAGRRLRSDDPGVTRNSLAGSDLTLVRDFLNRILSIGDSAEGSDPLDDAALAQGLDLGDETGNPDDALESGEEFSSQARRPTEKDARHRRAARNKATQEQIVWAVDQFNERIKDRAQTGQLTSFDVLRFRALLTIVAAAGQPSTQVPSEFTSLQVLPCDDGAEAWPRLMGRLLFTLFGGKRPAIRDLQIEAMHDRIPDDILECWATALWTVQACVAAAAAHRGLRQNVGAMLTTLVEQTYKRTGMRKDELQSGRVAAVFERLNVRFGERLGLDPATIGKAHVRVIAELFSSDSMDRMALFC